MVIALLLCLAGTVATGVVAYGERGPLAADGATIEAEVHAEESEPCGGAVEAEGSEGKKPSCKITSAKVTLASAPCNSPTIDFSPLEPCPSRVPPRASVSSAWSAVAMTAPPTASGPLPRSP